MDTKGVNPLFKYNISSSSYIQVWLLQYLLILKLRALSYKLFGINVSQQNNLIQFISNFVYEGNQSKAKNSYECILLLITLPFLKL